MPKGVKRAGLEEALGLSFADKGLLRLALVHRSYVHERPAEGPETNERLEFLGDAFLGLVVTEELYKRFPALQEGELTRLRSKVVRTESLARIGARLDLGTHLFLGRGEEQTGGRTRERNLARGLEALLGAVLLDQSYAKARRCTLRLIAPALDELSASESRDFKSLLQEFTQAAGHGPPTYRVLSAAGPAHRKEFIVEALLSGRSIGRGTGLSKRAAQEGAAREGLARLRESA